MDACTRSVPKYHINILLRDFNAYLGREDIFRATTGTDSLHGTSNDNEVRAVNFATSKNLIVTSTMRDHSALGQKAHHIDHVLVDR
jgi:hypothetical protein